MSKSVDDMEFHILNKLHRQTDIGMDYIPFHDVLQGLKPHQRSMKDAIKAAENLYKKGLVEFHKGKQCISIHRKRVDDVQEMLTKKNGL